MDEVEKSRLEILYPSSYKWARAQSSLSETAKFLIMSRLLEWFLVELGKVWESQESSRKYHFGTLNSSVYCRVSPIFYVDFMPKILGLLNF